MKLTREQARKDLRAYDNPRSGSQGNGVNPFYRNAGYLLTILDKYGMPESELREWSNNAKRQHKEMK